MKDSVRFNQIRDEIKTLAEEAVKMLPETEQQRAKSYWFAHICGALGGDYNEYLGGSMMDMESALKALLASEGETCAYCHKIIEGTKFEDDGEIACEECHTANMAEALVNA